MKRSWIAFSTISCVGKIDTLICSIPVYSWCCARRNRKEFVSDIDWSECRSPLSEHSESWFCGFVDNCDKTAGTALFLGRFFFHFSTKGHFEMKSQSSSWYLYIGHNQRKTLIWISPAAAYKLCLEQSLSWLLSSKLLEETILVMHRVNTRYNRSI